MTQDRAVGVVEEAAAGVDAGEDVVELADVDLAAEATFRRRPQEGDETCRGERREAGARQRDRRPVEELTTADTERLFIRRHPDSGFHRGGRHEARCRGDSLTALLHGPTGLRCRQVDLGVLVAATRFAAECAGTAARRRGGQR